MKKRAVLIINIVFATLAIATAIFVFVFAVFDYNPDDKFSILGILLEGIIFFVMICMLFICWSSVLYFAQSTKKTIVQTILHAAFILVSLLIFLTAADSLYPFLDEIGMDFLRKIPGTIFAKITLIFPLCRVFVFVMEFLWNLKQKRD